MEILKFNKNYNKNTLTPKLNNVEMQLLGNPWQLISQNGVPPSFTTFMTFFSQNFI